MNIEAGDGPSRERLLDALNECVNAWESLPGGEIYPAWKIERWLSGRMKTSINRARKVLGRKPPEYDR
jgi:hypothetical protein